jgi:hypothetical protein
MEPRRDVHDQVVLFLQEEFRGRFLLADPAEVCTVGFLEHLADFIAAQPCERCAEAETKIAALTRQVSNIQRWLRWATRAYRRGPQ